MRIRDFAPRGNPGPTSLARRRAGSAELILGKGVIGATRNHRRMSGGHVGRSGNGVWLDPPFSGLAHPGKGEGKQKTLHIEGRSGR